MPILISSLLNNSHLKLLIDRLNVFINTLLHTNYPSRAHTHTHKHIFIKCTGMNSEHHHFPHHSIIHCKFYAQFKCSLSINFTLKKIDDWHTQIQTSRSISATPLAISLISVVFSFTNRNLDSFFSSLPHFGI